MLQKFCISNECCSFALSILYPENKNVSLFSKEIWRSTTAFDIDNNVSWASNQYIIMISEGSWDTEDWSNDAEKSALIKKMYYILKYIQVENSSIAFMTFHNIMFFTVFLIK